MPRDPFADAVAIITGAGSGIGLSLANALARRGTQTVLADVDCAAIEKAASQICAAGGRSTALTVDVGSSGAVSSLLDRTVAQHGRVDYLFNNAGINVVGEALHLTLEDWERLVAVNLMGVAHGVLAAYPIMVGQGSGHIVNVASTAGVLPAPFQVAYAATKHAVVGLSLSLRAEAARYGVRVSVVCPGWIDTQMRETQRIVGTDREKVNAAVPFKYYPAELCAQAILEGVQNNQRMILVPRFPKWANRAHRWFPGLVEQILERVARRGL